MTPDSISSVYVGLQPPEVWRHFAALNATPRPSGQEAACRDWIEKLAIEHGAEFQRDARGNCVLRVAASSGREERAAVAIQAHLDMVCEKRPDVTHDFAVDAIQPRRDGDWIFASGTTLGADNGVGVAMSLALLTTPNLEHPPLELLFTVDEEVGLFGAADLDPALLSADWLINLDTEDPQEIIIGCAGGRTVDLHFSPQFTAVEASMVARRVVVSGLQGGHSGIQIHLPLKNALKVLCEVLRAAYDGGLDGGISEGGPNFGIARLDGGSAHNAIPRDASAEIVLAADDAARLADVIAQASERLQTDWKMDEAGLQIELTACDTPSKVADADSSARWLRLLSELPHGVLKMSQRFEGKVQTSCNLASVATQSDGAKIQLSVRSFVADDMAQTIGQITDIGQHAGATVEVHSGYPGWEPQADAPLIPLAASAHEKVYGRAPQIEVVHAGLECGIILDKRPSMAAVSFGPLILGAHTPEECVAISTVESSWKMLLELLRAL